MTFMKSKLLKIFIWIPAVICAVMIFGFSGQNGENSGNLSRKAAGVIVDIADSVHLVRCTLEWQTGTYRQDRIACKKSSTYD